MVLNSTFTHRLILYTQEKCLPSVLPTPSNQILWIFLPSALPFGVSSLGDGGSHTKLHVRITRKL